LLTRRQFIKVGLAGAVVLATVRFLDRALAAPAAGQRVLDEDATRMVAALVPVVLAGALPTDAAARARAIRETVEAFDRAVSGLTASVQDEVGQLFSFLNFGPTRVGFAGLWQPVDESSPEELKAFLIRWRSSTFQLQRASYHALTRLIQAAWYGNPASWATIAYPGPPELETR
jgi:hypothetical protein